MAAPVALGATAASAAPATALAAEASGGGQGAPSASGGGEAGGGGGAAAESAPADSAEAAEQEKTEAKMDGAAPEAAQEDAAVEAQGSPETGGASETAQAAAPPAAAAFDETAAGGGSATASMGESGANEAAEGDSDSVGGGGGGAEGTAAAAPTAALPSTESAQPAPDPDAAQRREDTQQARQEQADNRRVAEGVSEEHAEEQAEQQADSGGAPAGGAAELSSGEKDAGLASLAESPADGGGEAAPGGAVGGGGGGGGVPVPEPEPAPDTASQDPAAGLAAATALQPLQAGQALQGVGASIDTTAEQEGTALQEQMPPVEVGGDGSGGSAVLAAPEGMAPQATAEAPAAQAQPTPAAEPLPEPGPAPTAAIARPRITDTTEGTVSREDATRVATSVSSMPTSDPGLGASAGPAPQLAKVGDADPGQIHSQQSELDATIAAQKARGDADAAAPAGENDVRDRSPRQTLQAPRLATPGSGGASGAAPAGDEALGIIAEQKQGGEVRAAMAQAQGAMAAKRSEHQLKVGEEKAKSNAEITALQQENTSQQQAEKGKLQVEVGKARSDWTAEQNAEVSSTNNKAKAEIAKGNDKITKEEQQANEKAEAHISAGEAEAAEHKQQAETEAGAKKAEAERQKEDSGGIFSWIAAKVSAFFDALKSAITKVFDAARKLVKAAIDKAKQLAVAVIETARKAVVGLIKAVGAALIALGDVLLAAFPGLKKKWRAYIEAKVKAAENAVNRLADALKQGVTKLLDALGQAFDFLLNAYKKAMLAVLDVAKGVVMGAIKAAKGIADFLGTFVVLIKDIAKAPGQWISNLGAAVMDGIKNHLWKAFKTTVKGWFDSKLEEVLGVGTTIWNVLKQGGISLKQVGQMAFEALKAAIPSALIQLLIEKLVAMIVPAAGAVMAIIEGLQAAWPAIQRVIAAVGLFVVFLKAVKPGGAGPSFATMLAAGAVVVIDFVATWLLKKLRKPAGKLGSKVKAIAQKIIARVKKAMKKVGGWVKGKFKGLKQKFADWKAKRKAKKDAKQKGKEDPSKKKQDKEAEKRNRLEKAVGYVTPKVQAMLSRGVNRFVLKSSLLLWRMRFRIRVLRVVQSGTSTHVEAANSPTRITNQWFKKNRNEIYQLIKKIAKERYRGENAVAQPEIAAPFDQVAPGETLQGSFGGQRRGVARPEKGERGDFVFGKHSGESVHGESYGPLASRVQGSELSKAEVGAEMMSALRGGEVSPDIADLTALSFGAEVSRSRKHGGTSEVTSRLGLFGLREGRLGVEEAFGTSSASSAHNKSVRELGELRKAKAGKDVMAGARSREKELRLGTGGLVPETMRGYSSARGPAERLSSPGAKPPKENTLARRQAEETVNRTVELVYRAVGDNDYSNLSDLERDIRKALERVDRFIKP
jgi:chemotaxis protein histidine kinase CheA